MCAKLVDKYVSNILPWQANSFEHVDWKVWKLCNRDLIVNIYKASKLRTRYLGYVVQTFHTGLAQKYVKIF